ncbi:hypothetical protein PGB90_006777 [Kerria lacca]
MNQHNNLNFNPDAWSLQFIETPFKLYRLTNVFSNEGVLELKQELENLKFSDRMTDMYSFSQTEDLFNLKNKNKKTCISKFLQFLEYFRTLLSKKYNLILNSKISVSCSRYSYGDYLLCHDDKCEDRYIAFIFYLNFSWNPEWGGSLDIFNHTDDELPSELIYNFYPKFNSLIFFEIGPYTYHQVAEVTTNETSRITINGWYHSDEAFKIKSVFPHESIIPFLDTHTKGGLLYLQHFINAEFLKDEYTDLIVENMQQTGVMMLQDVLKNHVFERISDELNSSAVSWKKKGPPNSRRYDVADLSILPPLTKALVTFCQSKYMCSYLEHITQYKLLKKNKNDYVGASFAELQFWKSGYYSLLTDYDVNFKHSSLDILLFFNVFDEKNCSLNKNDNVSSTGNIYYYKKGTTSVVKVGFLVSETNDTLTSITLIFS